jgi:hypothetical protein
MRSSIICGYSTVIILLIGLILLMIFLPIKLMFNCKTEDCHIGEPQCCVMKNLTHVVCRSTNFVNYNNGCNRDHIDCSTQLDIPFDKIDTNSVTIDTSGILIVYKTTPSFTDKNWIAQCSDNKNLSDSYYYLDGLSITGCVMFIIIACGFFGLLIYTIKIFYGYCQVENKIANINTNIPVTASRDVWVI